ncbi:invasin domain 3-containing protein [Pontibacter silvestris]|uniref:Invasin domain 3-containing protein n=1 Tax=Pontibacter silvestris TaxID=2305183 RepID=A0ABW4X2C8_9BACT|nr:invasin domain 3-containing protein [Pontibacter silvestris]MCC9135784.1 gliding motility-associated C-terminal domain-containing protein [Pontibacter silvestris]
MLDPNNDGYTSKTTAGFKNNDRGGGESEINYKAIPILDNEPIEDPLRGPGCGFTDMVDSGIGDPVMFFFDGTNFLVRFRLNKTSPNSKGYSVLIDTDQKFGFSGPNADPNAVAGNPGFEMELVLKSNHGVGLYAIDGSTTPTLIAEREYESHAQKSIAFTEECGDMDFFYDFYIPWSDFRLPLDTKLRMAALTVMNPHASTGNNAKSDVGGIDDRKYGDNYDKLFEDFIQNANPTSPQDINAGFKARTLCPSINASIEVTSTSITGASKEAAGTIITVYKNNAVLGTTTTSGGTWSLAVSGLTEGDVITASAKAAEKEESESNCSGVLVGQVCSRPATPTLSTSSGNSNKYVAVTLPAGYTTGRIDIFLGTTLKISQEVTGAGPYYYCLGSTSFANKACSGGNNLEAGVYRATLTIGGCTSNSVFLCVNGVEASAIPVINAPITTASKLIAGTAVPNAQVILKINGAEKVIVTADAVGKWSVPASSLGLKDTDKVSAYALEVGKCQSSETTQVTVTKPLSVAPTLTGSYCGTTNTVTGTSAEAAGTTIKLFIGASTTPIATTTTDAAGYWVISGLSLTPGTELTAKATALDKTESAASATVTVKTVSSSANITIDGTTDSATSEKHIMENADVISGTGSGETGTVSLYLDEMFIGSGTLEGGVWKVKKASFPNDFYLFAGANLTATFTATGGCESNHTPVTVAIRCAPPTDKAITPTNLTLCTGATPEVTVKESEAFLIYQVYNEGTPVSSSILGTGGDILLKSLSPLTTTTPNTIINLKVIASKIPYVKGINCELPLSEQVVVTVNPEIKDNTISLAGTTSQFCGPTEIGTIIGSTPTGGNNRYTYQWQISTDNASWTNINGATERDYDPGIVSGNTYYRREVFSGECSNVDASASVQVTIHEALNNTVTYSGQASFCASGDPAEIQGNEDASFVSYQWQSSLNGETFFDIDGATAASYSPGNLSQTTTFRRLVSNGTCDSYSILVKISIYPTTIENNRLTAPGQSLLCGPGSVGQIIGTVLTDEGNTYTYRWQKSTDNGISFSDIYPAVTTENYTPGTVASTTYFRRIVESGACAYSESDMVKVTVVSLIKSSITTDASILAADGTSSTTIRVELKDDFENNITADVCNLELATDKGAITNMLPTGNGTYTATLTAGNTAGDARVRATINGALISDDAVVSFVPALKLAATSVSANPTALYADGTSTSLATVVFKDYAGNPIAVEASRVELLLDGVAIIAEGKGNGTFTATIPARTTAANVIVTAKYNGTKAGGEAIVNFEAIPATPSLATANITASPAHINADGMSTAVATVQFKDEDGENIAVDAAKVQILLDHVVVSFSDKGNGLFEIEVPARTTAATVDVTTMYDGASMGNTASVEFVPVINPAATLVSANPAVVNADGTSTSTAKVEFKDYAGNPIDADFNKASMLLDGTITAVQSGLTGIFTAVVPARTTAATVQITVKYDGTLVNSKAEVEFVPVVTPQLSLQLSTVALSSTTVIADGVSSSLIAVLLEDTDGHYFITDKPVAIFSDFGTVGATANNGNGRYTARLTSSVTGTANITVQIGTEKLPTNLAVTFVAGSASSVTSTMAASAAVIPADGVSSSTITITLFDAQGNRVTTGGNNLVLTTTSGTLGAVIDNNDGTYTAVLTSGTASRTARVSGTIDGAAINNTVNIMFTDVPVANLTPVAVSDSFTMNNNEKLTGNVLLNDIDSDGNQLSVKTALLRQPLFGTIVMQANGSFTYTPNKGYTGEDSFSYEACDNGSLSMCAQATVTIQVKQGQVFIPEGFSPDGDGENDLFKIYGAEQYKVSLKVFNRWGDVVYENKIYKNDWNGTANKGFIIGDKLPDGTYFSIVDLNNGEKPKAHSLIIKRK